MARTDSLTNYLTDVATAIKNKKGDQTSINASDFDTEITNLPSGSTVTPVTFPDDTALSIAFIQTSGVPSMTQSIVNKIAPITEIVKGIRINERLFYQNSSVTDLSGWKNCRAYSTGTNGTGYYYLFYQCTALTTLPTLDWSNVTQIGYSFYYCSSLTTIPDNYFSTLTNTSIGMYGAFNSCTLLTSLNCIRNIKPNFIRSAFAYCTGLTTFPEMDFSLLNNGVASSQQQYCIRDAFRADSALTNDSLHNIIKSLATIPSATNLGTKTLKYAGLDSTQATTCTTFTEWATLEANGWTTGY